MFEITHQGLRIEPTLAAARELTHHNCDLYDVLSILEEGYDCCASKRKANILEKCVRRGNKELKAVVAKTEVEYPDKYKEEVWRLIHFGIKTFKRR